MKIRIKQQLLIKSIEEFLLFCDFSRSFPLAGFWLVLTGQIRLIFSYKISPPPSFKGRTIVSDNVLNKVWTESSARCQ